MKNLNRINLGGLRAIEAVARLGNLAKAAEELGVTPGAVSQQLLKAELNLGSQLFLRHPKGLSPTLRCEELLPHLALGMLELSKAVAIAGRQHSDVLVVSVAPVFASKWLVWRIGDFSAQHPDIGIRLDATNALVDPNSSDVDICIRVGRGDWPNMVSTKVMDQLVFPVCSPEIAAGLNDPQDLASVPIIRDQSAMFGWSTWLGPTGLDDAILGKGPVFSDASLCLDAAVAGLGVFLGWDSLAQDALKSGRLVAPFHGKFPSGFAFWLVEGQSKRKTRSVCTFETWLSDRLRQDCGQ
jgi:LysR family transcriptional regulator, glycine cleavage system transcriptional activator